MELSRSSRSLRSPVVRAVLLIGVLTAPFPLRAEIPDDAMSIGLRIEPAWTLPGGQVTLAGTTVADGRRMTVTLRIVEPDSMQVERTAAVAAEDGAYRLVLGKLAKPGRYEVTAIAPDRRGRASGSFRVLAPAEALEEVTTGWSAILDDAARAVERAGTDLAELPPSPPRAEAEEKLAQLRRELAKRGDDAAALGGALTSVGDLLESRPAVAPAFAPLLDSLGAWSRASESRRVEINRQLIESSRRGEVCESIHAAGEGIKVASALVNLAGTAVDIAYSFLRDFLAAGVQSALPEPARSEPTTVFAVGEVVKNGVPVVTGLRARYGVLSSGHETVVRQAGGRQQLAGILVGMCYDLAGLFTDRLFERFCEKLEGPVGAALHVEFADAAGVVWWKYDLGIEGRLQLRYARGAPGEALRVRGEFLGAASNFTLWENALQTLDPALMRGQVAWKKAELPTVPFVNFEGDYLGALAGKNAFFVPVSGDLVDDRLVLRVEPAKVDFEGVTAHEIYVILGVRTMGFPVVVEVPFPYKGAYFLITRAADAKEQSFVLPVRIDRAGRRVVAERSFARPGVQGDGNVADYAMTIRVCSPAC